MTPVISIRLEDSVYEETKLIARRRAVSMNALVERALRKEIKLDQEGEMYEAATLLGQDADSEVGYAVAAQAEIVMGD